VHRDISPNNIFITFDGGVKVLDFGVAKAAQEALTTKPGHITGKLCYMSPEQALGLPLNAGSDVFSAGAVLWELLTGERLFRTEESSPVAILQKVLHDEIPSPTRLRTDVPGALESVVMRALERDLDARFQSALEFALAVEGAVTPASAFSIGQYLQRLSGESLRERAAALDRFRSGAAEQRSFEITSALALGPGLDEGSLWGEDSFAELPPVERRPPSRHKPARRLVTPLKVGATFLLLGSALAVAWSRWKLTPPAAAGATSVVVHPGPRTEPSEAARVTAPVATSRDTVAPASVAPSSTPSTRPATGPELVAKPRARSMSRQPSSAPSNCSPPTYVDADGIRHFKPHCL